MPVSERRDLWMPGLLALLGPLLLAANLLYGVWWVGALACAAAFAAALGCMPMRLQRGQGRMVSFGSGAALCLVPAIPPPGSWPLGVLPWWVAGLALLRPLPPASPAMRQTLLVGALAMALLALIARLGVLPPRLGWLFLAAAFHLGWQVLASRPPRVVEVPVGPRVAVFGGTFDPFHRAHRAILEAAIRVADRVLVVVAGTPPHKAASAERTAFHHRVAMTRLGVENLHRVEVLELEGRRPGPSYTVDTLDALARSYPAGTRFLLILGADSFEEFPTWHEWERILERATLLVAPRPGHELDTPPEFEGRNMPVELLDVEPADVSSRAIREGITADREPGDALSPPVRTYIRDHGLYKGAGMGEVALRDAPSAPPTD